MISLMTFSSFNLDGFEIDTSFTNLSRINLIAGMNGAGKTLMLKCLWYFDHIIQAYTVSVFTDPLTAHLDTLNYVSETAEYLFDTKNINGSIKIISDRCDLYIEFKNGQAKFCNFDIKKPQDFSLENLHKNTYISDTAKDWKNYERYLLKMKQYSINFVNGIKEIRQLKNDFALYDIAYFTEVKYILDQIMLSGNKFPLTSITDTFGERAGVFLGDYLYVKKSIPYITNGYDIKKLSNFSTGNANLISTILFWTPNQNIHLYIEKRKNV